MLPAFRDRRGERGFVRMLLEAIVLPAIALIVLAALLVWQVVTVKDTAGSVDRSDQVISHAHALGNLLSEMEAGVRGYLLTGNSVFLEPYVKARASIGPTLAALDRLVQDPTELEVLNKIRHDTMSWLRFGDAAMRMRRSGGPYASYSTNIVGKQIMDITRGDIDRFMDRAQVLRSYRSEKAERATSAAGYLAVLGVVPVLIVLVLGTRRALKIHTETQQRDFEERLKLEHAQRVGQELQEQYLRMQEANQMKSEFVANMSHELRTPLTAIMGLSEMMRDGKAGPLTDKQMEYLDDVLASGHHLLDLINEVLDLAKVEAGRLEILPEPTDPSQLAREVVEVLRPLAAQKSIELAVDLDRAPQTVRTDPARFKQILYNYLSNAIKFTSNGGSVFVRLSIDEADCCRIEVQDTGSGIAREDIDKLFSEFSQLNAGSAKEHEGAGLGLALTKRVVEAQGGTVRVQSRKGEGSTFYAVLPGVISAERSEDASLRGSVA